MSDVNFNQKKGWATKWSEEEENILIENYASSTIDEILQLLPNRSKKAIYSKAHSLGLKYHNYNKDYFNKIDTPEKAYWIGFLTADGYITTKYRWGVEIQIEDIKHLEKLNKALDSNITIRIREKESFGKINKSCSLTFKNKDMYDDLVNLGFTHDKSHEAKLSNLIPREFIIDFIKGIIDGDGSYINTDKAKLVVLYSGSLIMLEDIQNILKEYNITSSIYNNNGTYRLTIKKREDLKIFLDIILSTESPMLSRKELKAKKLLSEIGGGR